MNMPATGGMSESARTGIWAMTGFVCLVIIAFVGWHIWSSRDHELANARRASANLARSVGEHADDTFSSVDNLLAGTIDQWTMARATNQPFSLPWGLIASQTPRVPFVQMIAIFDAHGDLVLSSLSRTPPATNYADRAYFRHHAADPDPGPYIGLPVTSKLTGTAILTLSRRLSDADGGFAGVVVATIPIDAFIAFYDTFDIGRDGAIGLMRGDGRILARRPFRPEDLGRDLSAGAVWKAAQGGLGNGTLTTRSAVDGEVRIGGFQRVERFGVTVLAGMSTEEALTAWRADAVRQVGSAALIVAAIVFMAARLLRQVGALNRAQADLRSSELLHRSITDNLHDLVMRVRPDGSRVFVSSAAERVVGASAAEVMAKRVGSFVAPEYAEENKAARARMFAGGPMETLTYEAVRADGKRVWIEARHALLPETREMVIVMRDVSAARRIEAQLEAACRHAEAASRAKSEFLANMSHEIRTPMNGIIGMTALLLASNLSAQQQRFAEAVRVSADALMGLIDDILDISKLEAGKLVLEQVPFAPEDVVDAAVELLAPRAQAKGLEVAVDMPANARPVLGDPTRLRQVVLNLISNAIKFTEHGFVVIEVTAEPTDAERTALSISVRDTGIGIDPAARARLFNKFEQADGSVTRRFGGSGLGLAICKQLVELMDGWIEVESAPGRGSRFTVRVKLPNGPAVLASRDARARSLRGLRVLCVDDLEINRTVLRRQLAPLGVAVAEASGGAEALRMLAAARDDEAPFHILLTDEAMPEMSGSETAALAREVQPEGLRIVLASSIGHAVADPLFDGMLPKPIRRRDLIDCLSRDQAPVAETAAAPEGVAVQQGGAGAARVLIAEDNAINRMLVETLLQGAGYATAAAGDGFECVAMAKRDDFDLILMDVQMPEMDGVAATRALRAEGGVLAHIPIVALTANAMSGDRETYLDAGMNDYLSKPIDPKALLATVARWTGRDMGAAETEADAALDPVGGNVVDAAALDQLASMLSAGKVAGLLRMYLDGLDPRAAEIAAAAADGDMRALGRLAHDLKSTSGNFGAVALRDLARALEAACAADDVARARVLAARIGAAAEATAACLAPRIEALAEPV